LLARATVADAEKNRMFFGISGRGIALLDNVSATEERAARRLAEIKAKLGNGSPRKRRRNEEGHGG